MDQIELPEVLGNDLEDLGPAAQRWALEAVTAGSHQIVTDADQWREAVRAYLACVTFVDRQIGRLMKALSESAHADNTLIVLWSDHGWHLGEKQHWGKWTGWRQSTRVPLIVVPPLREAAMPRGEVCDQAVSLVDLYPSLIELCALEKRHDLAGVSFASLLANPAEESDRSILTTFDSGNHALTTMRWRYLRYREGEEELYDTANDPDEWHNLIDDDAHQDDLRRVRDLLDNRLRETEAQKPGRL